MNSLITFIYLIDVLDAINFWANMFAFSILFVIANLGKNLFKFYSYKYATGTEEYGKYKLSIIYIKKAFIVLLISLITLTVIPNKKSLIMMASLYTGDKLMTEVNKTPLTQKAYKLLEKEINEYLHIKDEITN